MVILLFYNSRHTMHIYPNLTSAAAFFIYQYAIGQILTLQDFAIRLLSNLIDVGLLVLVYTTMHRHMGHGNTRLMTKQCQKSLY